MNILWAAALLLPSLAHSDPIWFTLAGDPRDEHADTIVIDVASLKRSQNLQSMTVRVSRGHERRSNFTGYSFRSYAALAQIDCALQSARLVDTTFYAEPLWQGEPKGYVEFKSRNVPLALREFDPNPMPRLMRAACQS